VQEEVRKVNKHDSKGAGAGNGTSSGVVIVSGVAKKKSLEDKKKGELIEQNQDGLEVSFRKLLHKLVLATPPKGFPCN